MTLSENALKLVSVVALGPWPWRVLEDKCGRFLSSMKTRPPWQNTNYW